VSHEHRDHYDPRIWEWQDQISDITYIFGFKPQLEEDQDYVFLPARRDTVINDIKITTIESNDTGVGFLLEVDNLTILHPGDHANRERDFSGTYLAEIDFLKARQPVIDISFMPISGCGFGDQEAVKMGVYRTIEELEPQTFFPMHAIGAEYRYSEFIEQMETDHDYDIQSVAATNLGDRFFYKKGKIKLLVKS
jgi:L-ascorbate metabolism protein UlaG (beta-lactamase superfamily)